MNKENIEKKKRMLKDFSEKGQGQRVFFEEDLELIRDILQHLEQKESILDKVTNIVKIIIKRTETEFMYGTTDMLEDLQETLNIIEGGRNGK